MGELRGAIMGFWLVNIISGFVGIYLSLAVLCLGMSLESLDDLMICIL